MEMKALKIKSLKFVQLLLAVIFLLAISITPMSCSSQKEYSIIIAGDYSGKTSGIGNSVYRGAEYVIKTMGNELSRGIKISIRKEDDGGDDDTSRTIAKKSSNDATVLAVIGHSTSGNTIAAQDIYGPNNIPIFLPVATNPQITKDSAENNWNNVYRLVPTDDLQASKIAEYSNKYIAPKNILILNDDTSYGENLGRSLVKSFSNINVLDQILIHKNEDEENIKAKLRKALSKNKSPDIIIYAGYYREGGLITSFLRKSAFKNPIFLTDGCFVPDIFKLFGSNPGKVFIAFISPDIENLKNGVNLINEIKKMDPEMKESDLAYAPFGADSVRIVLDISQIILTKKDGLNRKDIINYLNRNIKNRSFNNNLILGPYNFNQVGDNEKGKNYIYKLNISKDKKMSWTYME